MAAKGCALGRNEKRPLTRVKFSFQITNNYGFSGKKRRIVSLFPASSMSDEDETGKAGSEDPQVDSDAAAAAAEDDDGGGGGEAGNGEELPDADAVDWQDIFPETFQFCVANCFRGWKTLTSTRRCEEALAMKIKIDKFDLKGSLTNMRKHNADVKAFLAKGEKTKMSAVAECNALQMDVEKSRVYREGLEGVKAGLAKDLLGAREHEQCLEDELSALQQEKEALQVRLERAERQSADTKLLNQGLSQQLAATNQLLQQEKEARAADAKVASAKAADLTAALNVAQEKRQVEIQALHDQAAKTSEAHQKQFSEAVAQNERQLESLRKVQQFQEQRITGFVDEQGQLVERITTLNQENGSLKSQLEHLKKLKSAGDAAALSELLESQTQALEAQCRTLQQETNYIRKQASTAADTAAARRFDDVQASCVM